MNKEIMSELEKLGWTVERSLTDFNCYLRIDGIVAIADDQGICVEDDETVIDSFPVDGLSAGEIDSRTRKIISDITNKTEKERKNT